MTHLIRHYKCVIWWDWLCVAMKLVIFCLFDYPSIDVMKIGEQIPILNFIWPRTLQTWFIGTSYRKIRNQIQHKLIPKIKERASWNVMDCTRIHFHCHFTHVYILYCYFTLYCTVIRNKTKFCQFCVWNRVANFPSQ